MESLKYKYKQRLVPNNAPNVSYFVLLPEEGIFTFELYLLSPFALL